MKDQLIFDVTDADTIADSDSVGAFLRASDGTLLTHSDVGGKKALDVSIADGVNVEVDLSHIDDSVRLGDGTSFFTSTSENGDIALDVHLSNSSIVVTATDLDIRDLAFATDSVDVSGSEVSLDAATLAALETINAVQSGVWDIGTVTTLTGITNDVNIADGGNSITVDAVDLDIRNLVAATDSVQSNMFDGAGTALTSTLVGGDQALDVNISNEISVNDAALADTAILSAADTLALAGTAESVVASNLAARKYLLVRNNDNRVMYIGAAGVTAANGFPVSPGSYLEMRAGAAVSVFYNSEKTGHAIRTLELS